MSKPQWRIAYDEYDASLRKATDDFTKLEDYLNQFDEIGEYARLPKSLIRPVIFTALGLAFTAGLNLIVFLLVLLLTFNVSSTNGIIFSVCTAIYFAITGILDLRIQNTFRQKYDNQ